MTDRIRHDGPLIIGGGLAGLSAALAAAPRPTLVVSPAPLLQQASSAWAQGGLAAAVSASDSCTLHAADTVSAGAGLVDPDVARALTQDGPETVDWLASLGAPFDRTRDGGFAASLEAAHSRPRVVRVGGDGTGRAILSALAVAARAAPHVSVWEDGRLLSLFRDHAGRVRGAVLDRAGRRVEVLAPAVVLATGGGGGLFARTTTPASLLGEGMAAAWAAGADILDPEFVQFHPTAIDVGLDPMPLATEALRGEGARLVDRHGTPLSDTAQGDMGPRDRIARRVHAAVADGRGAFLDCRAAVGDAFPASFPTVFAACMRAGLDPRLTPIPVAPAAHYCMGGVAADIDGRTSLEGLFAVGECAATGVHGANRLASNSLLEAAAFGRRAGRRASAGDGPTPAPLEASPPAPAALSSAQLAGLRRMMSDHAGVVRGADGLGRTLDLIGALDREARGALPAIAARLIVEAALARRESRGGHYREDFPMSDAIARHTRVARAVSASAAA